MLASMADLVAAACFRPYIMVPGAAKTHMQGRCKELPASVLTELDPFDVYVAMEDRHRLEELKGDSGNTKDTYSRHGGYKEIGYRAQHKEMVRLFTDQAFQDLNFYFHQNKPEEALRAIVDFNINLT